MSTRSPRVVVIGAGAAGSMAAIFAARAGADVTVLERTRDGGRKILISGGGRCNVLPMTLDAARFVTDSSMNSLKRIARSWPLDEQRAFFERDLALPLVAEPESSKLFPASQRARDVRDALLRAAQDAGARLRFDTLVQALAPLPNGRWRIDLAEAESLDADAVIVATGGLSVPNTGSDGAGLRWLAKLGHRMHPTYAALTPVLASNSPFATLAGVSFPIALDARSSARTASAHGGFLFTHHGYSGPAALDVSHVIVRARAERSTATANGSDADASEDMPNAAKRAHCAKPAADAKRERSPESRSDAVRSDAARSDAAPAHGHARLFARWTAHDEAAWTASFNAQGQGARNVLHVLRQELPERLALVLLDLARVPTMRTLAELRRDERLRLIDVLVRCPLPWHGDEGYKKAEVTGGGVDLSEVDPRTLESRVRPGLFLCGELLDAFGPIGGYNFLWAWATGRAAGLGAAARRIDGSSSVSA